MQHLHRNKTPWSLLCHVSRILGVGCINGVLSSMVVALWFSGQDFNEYSGKWVSGVDGKKTTSTLARGTIVFACLFLFSYVSSLSSFPGGGLRAAALSFLPSATIGAVIVIFVNYLCETFDKKITYYLIQEYVPFLGLVILIVVDKIIRKKVAAKHENSLITSFNAGKRRRSSLLRIEEKVADIKSVRRSSFTKKFAPLFVCMSVMLTYLTFVLPVYFSSNESTRILICTVVHPLSVEFAEAATRIVDGAAWTQPQRVAQKCLRTFLLKQFLAFARRLMMMNVGSYRSTLLVILAASIEEAVMVS